jgi:hypothetical protein
VSTVAPPRARPRDAARRPTPPPAGAGRPRAAPAAAPAAAARRLPATGVMWLLFVAVLFGGIVALNVAALRASLALNDLTGRTEQLRLEHDVLAADLTELSAPDRIAREADRIGMVPAVPAPGDYLDLDRSDEPRRERPVHGPGPGLARGGRR